MSQSITIAFIDASKQRQLCTVSPDKIITIGKNASSVIQQLHPFVVDLHCKVRFSTSFNCWIVEDQGSSKGTYLNGDRISKARALSNNDKLRLGSDGPILSVGLQLKTISTPHQISNQKAAVFPPAVSTSSQKATNESIDPDFSTTFNNHGKKENDLGDKEGAIADYGQAIEICSQFVMPYKEKSHIFSYMSLADISHCTGKSISEVRDVCRATRSASGQKGCTEPFSLFEADRMAAVLTGYPSIKRAWEQRNRIDAQTTSFSYSTGENKHNLIPPISQPVKEFCKVEPIEGLDDFIGMVKDGYAFQVRDVLERIVNAERERIEGERAVWKIGVGIATFFCGASIDGLDAGDLFTGWTFSNIGGAAHQLASKKQVEFLKKLQSEWLVLDRSPMDIRRRLGEPQGRFIGISRSNILDMFNIHQSGSRGFNMVELDFAGNIATGFQDPQSLEVLQRSYDEEGIGIISLHLYPSTITPLKLCRTITPDEAIKKDPYYSQLSKAGAPFRVVYSDDTEGIMYKIQIPHHSDY